MSEQNEAGHTKGVWRAVGHNPPRVYCGPEIICVVDSMGELSTAQEIANARLIAAAPTLLRALQELLDEVEGLDDYTLTRDTETYKAQAIFDAALDNARAALSKARPT